MWIWLRLLSKTIFLKDSQRNTFLNFLHFGFVKSRLQGHMNVLQKIAKVMKFISKLYLVRLLNLMNSPVLHSYYFDQVSHPYLKKKKKSHPALS